MKPSHLIEYGDPHPHQAFCRCGWRVHFESRNKLAAESHRHLADALDPPNQVVTAEAALHVDIRTETPE